ncbi:MAG: hypothetical protein FP826_10965 [Sphingomonadales bacterium]|nr:hypothetical protein [Sphingomonadales bacterium]
MGEAVSLQVISTKVLIVGAGPCGVTIANHLGMYGVDTIIVDREDDIIPYPRAVGIDDEALRGYQTVGLVDVLLKDMIQNTAARYHTSRGPPFRGSPAAGAALRLAAPQSVYPAADRDNAAQGAGALCLRADDAGP